MSEVVLPSSRRSSTVLAAPTGEPPPLKASDTWMEGSEFIAQRSLTKGCFRFQISSPTPSGCSWRSSRFILKMT